MFAIANEFVALARRSEPIVAEKDAIFMIIAVLPEFLVHCTHGFVKHDPVSTHRIPSHLEAILMHERVCVKFVDFLEWYLSISVFTDPFENQHTLPVDGHYICMPEWPLAQLTHHALQNFTYRLRRVRLTSSWSVYS